MAGFLGPAHYSQFPSGINHARRLVCRRIYRLNECTMIGFSPFEKTSDDSLVRSDGSVIHYSAERFVTEIVKGNACFICGAAPEKAAFNDEHVIPKWLLRSLDLYDSTVTLPSGSNIRYGQWTLPCCVGCNTLLGEKVESPVSELMKGGYEGVVSTLQNEGPWILFYWVNLIFLKTYLKSMALRFHLDHRKGEMTIGETIDWGTMHHIHCVVRSILTGTKIDPCALGSFFLLPAKTSKHSKEFDYDGYHWREDSHDPVQRNCDFLCPR
jgi:hypothetical protein